MRQRKRMTALLMAGMMVFTNLPVNALAVEKPDTGGLCEHHPEHTAECGYVAGDSSEDHVHTDDCYQEIEDCVHIHTSQCYESGKEEVATPFDAYPVSTPPDGILADPAACSHMCSEESGCIWWTLICGYERSCTYLCEICHPQPMLLAADEGEFNINSGMVTIENTCGSSCQGHTIRGDGTTTANPVRVITGGTHTITIEDVDIDVQKNGDTMDRCAFDMAGADVTLLLRGENQMSASLGAAAIETAYGFNPAVPPWGQRAEGKRLVIECGEHEDGQCPEDGSGCGILEVTGGKNAAGIGNGYQGSKGEIIINSGVIRAYGETGIGIQDGTVTINGGVVTVDQNINGDEVAVHDAKVTVGNKVNADSVVVDDGILIVEGTINGTLSVQGAGAVVSADYISDKSEKEHWQGIVWDKNGGGIYGELEYTLDSELILSEGIRFEISDGSNLIIGGNGYLENHGTITVKDGGTLTILGEVADEGDVIVEPGGTIIRRNINAPSAPSLETVGGTYVILGKIQEKHVWYGYTEGNETRVPEERWQESNGFSNLKTNTTYQFYARYLSNYVQSEPSSPTVCTTKDKDEMVMIDSPETFKAFVDQANALNNEGDLVQAKALQAVLSQDIDMSGWKVGENMDSLGAFYGSLDGRGHVIRNLQVGTQDGMIGNLYGTIKNLGITEMNFDSGTNTHSRYGAICNNLQEGGLIENCYVTDSTVRGEGPGTLFSGAIAGDNYGVIRNSYSLHCTLEARSTRGRETGTGGISGRNAASSRPNGIIENCYSDQNLATEKYAGTIQGGGANQDSEFFGSGEAAYGLNEDPDQPVWYQTLGEDDSPVLDNGHAVVRRGYAHGETQTGVWSYANTALHSAPDSDGSHDRTYQNGICQVCGKRKGITVSFDPRGGSAQQSRQVTFGDPYGTLPVPTREGYTFGGWYFGTDWTQKAEASTEVSDFDDHTLYASWISLQVMDLEFDEAAYGYGTVSGQEIHVTNAQGEKAPEIADVRMADDACFEVWHENGRWLAAPEIGLKNGMYTADVTVIDKSGAQGRAKLRFQVEKRVLKPVIVLQDGTEHADKSYDGTVDVPKDSLCIRLEGVQNGDGVWAEASFAYESPQAGTKRIHATGITLMDNEEENYILSADTAMSDQAGEIRKAEPVVSWPEVGSLVYGQTLGNLALSGGTAAGADGQPLEGRFGWQDETTKPAVSDSGKTMYTLGFIPADTLNYETVWNTGQTVQVSPRPLQVELTAAPETGTATQDTILTAELKEAMDVDLPAGTVRFWTEDGEMIATNAAIVKGKDENGGSRLTATAVWHQVPGGSHTLYAEYIPSNGEDNYCNGLKGELRYQAERRPQEPFTFTEESPDSVVFTPGGTFQIRAEGGSGSGAMRYQVSAGSDVVSVDDAGMVTIRKGGKAVITAVKAGDRDYMETMAVHSITIEPGEGQLHIACADLSYREEPNPRVLDTTNTGAAVTYQYEGRDGTQYGPSQVPPLEAGTYTVTGIAEETENYHRAVSEAVLFEISRAVPELVLSASRQSVRGGGRVTLQLTGLEPGEEAVLTSTWENAVLEQTGEFVWTARIPNRDLDVVFTASYPGSRNYTPTAVTCLVKAQRRNDSDGGSIRNSGTNIAGISGTWIRWTQNAIFGMSATRMGKFSVPSGPISTTPMQRTRQRTDGFIFQIPEK
ncbi:MAG: InlB B-repeat-containing protein [Lachnospiraceae bacterium]